MTDVQVGYLDSTHHAPAPVEIMIVIDHPIMVGLKPNLSRQTLNMGGRMAPKSPPMPHLFEKSALSCNTDGDWDLHDTVSKAFLLVKPFRHVVHRWGEKHAGADSIKWPKTYDELEWLFPR